MSELVSPPLLLYKVGIFGSFPPGFGVVMARELDAELITKRTVISEWRRTAIARGVPSPYKDLDSKIIAQSFKSLAVPLLRDGVSVVSDLSFNSNRKRQDYPISMARDTGAFSVALCARAPDDVVRGRLAELERPGKEFNLPNMLKQVDWPKPDFKGPDYVFPLDGAGNVDQLVDDVLDFLDEASI